MQSGLTGEPEARALDCMTLLTLVDQLQSQTHAFQVFKIAKSGGKQPTYV